MMVDRHGRVTTLGAVEAFFGGIGFILTTPRMWPLAVVPAAILTVLLITSRCWGFGEDAGVRRLPFGPDRGVWGAIGYWASPLSSCALSRS